MTLYGVETNTEFLFRAPSMVANSNTTQLIGVPVDVHIESLSIQHSIAAASVIFSMYYSALSLAVPLQVDMWLRLTEDLQIEAYDLSARQLEKSFVYVRPALAQQIMKETSLSESTIDNATAVIAQRAATDVCNAATTYCTGENAQYDSFDECYSQLSEMPFESDLDICRYIHKDMVKFRPNVHCPSLSPSGGTTCASADYINATLNYPFVSSFVSANVTGSGTDKLSETTLEELMKMNMMQIYPTTVAFYGIPTFVYFIILYLSGKLTELAFLRFSTVFPALSFENKRNTVTYGLNTFYTTIALLLQLLSSPMLAEKYTLNRMGEIRFACVVVSGLYLYEMIYRSNMRWTLLVHHICTLFSLFFMQAALQISLNPAIFSLGVIWLFQATTEQSIFIGLLLYRLRYPKRLVQTTLKCAAVQSFIFKMAFAVYLMIWWGLKLAKYHQDIDVALSVMLVLIATLLMATQVYGSWAVWCIAVNMDKRADPEQVIMSREHTKEPAEDSFENKSLDFSVLNSTVAENTGRHADAPQVGLPIDTILAEPEA
ncbi:hypothetical protein BDZ89DRAFT_1061460 [Hymenopellis radicata]|nr:hypothetical protein BDZ89DRAFT_1061460 [Hymenopellis radicata]